MQNDYLPRDLHDRTVTALTDRCISAEAAIRTLLELIDPEILGRHAGDWLAAVQELTA